MGTSQGGTVRVVGEGRGSPSSSAEKMLESAQNAAQTIAQAKPLQAIGGAQRSPLGKGALERFGIKQQSLGVRRHFARFNGLQTGLLEVATVDAQFLPMHSGGNRDRNGLGRSHREDGRMIEGFPCQSAKAVASLLESGLGGLGVLRLAPDLIETQGHFAELPPDLGQGKLLLVQKLESGLQIGGDGFEDDLFDWSVDRTIGRAGTSDPVMYHAVGKTLVMVDAHDAPTGENLGKAGKLAVGRLRGPAGLGQGKGKMSP